MYPSRLPIGDAELQDPEAQEAVVQKMVEDFFSKFDAMPLLNTFNMLEHTLVWIKDAESRIMFANTVFIHQYGANSLDQLIGKCDYDVSPIHIAKNFIDDDRNVLRGRAIRNRLELNVQRSGEIAWFETNKFPLTSANGRIIGTYGMSRRRDRQEISLAAVEQLETPIDYIRANYGKDIPIEKLAAISCISVSALERRFKKYLHKSPRQFINEFRLQQACCLLRETSQSIASIATAVGFTDPSYFTRTFSRLYHCTPKSFRADSRKQLETA